MTQVSGLNSTMSIYSRLIIRVLMASGSGIPNERGWVQCYWCHGDSHRSVGNSDSGYTVGAGGVAVVAAMVREMNRMWARRS